ncbi:hypothetical protein [Streptomyces sp. NPDC047108]|uniref:hypothetical protein n=1 Tax=Streptomyces sp. NPDC047108 TaxID=3155025 RepID=UPI0033DE713C
MHMSRKSGVLVASAVCGVLVIGTGAAVAVTDTDTGAQSRTATERKASDAPLPGADNLLGQAKLLGDMGSITRPVNDLVQAVLQAPEGRLPIAEATSRAEEIKQALASVTQTPVQPSTQPAPGPEDPVVLPAYDLPGPAAKSRRAGDPGQDLKAKAVADLQSRLDSLLQALSAGDPSAISPAVQNLLTGTVNVVTSVMVGGGLPAANLDGLPRLPQLPGTPQIPTSPGASDVPASPEVPGASQPSSAADSSERPAAWPAS